MDRRWLGGALAVALGVAGFALAIGLDEIEGSSTWPGGPEIVVVIAIAATLAAAVGLAWALDRRAWTSLGLTVVLAGAGFALAWGGFLALVDVGGGCGYTPTLDADSRHEGRWDNDTARFALEAEGLTVTRVEATMVRASTIEDGVELHVHVSVPGTADPDPIRLSASFWPEESLPTSQDARDWTEANRERIEDRHRTFLADFEAETGWQRTGNVTWTGSSMVC